MRSKIIPVGEVQPKSEKTLTQVGENSDLEAVTFRPRGWENSDLAVQGNISVFASSDLEVGIIPTLRSERGRKFYPGG